MLFNTLTVLNSCPGHALHQLQTNVHVGGRLRAQTTQAPLDTESRKEPQVVDWERQWYPVAVEEELDPKLPHAMRLLGKELVLWRERSGSWRCFQDACPHRMVPLSEGRIDTDSNTLMCSYHGWKFTGDGSCVRNPQARFTGTEEVACRNKRARARAYPTQNAQGLVWVWAECGNEAYIESSMTPAPLLPEYEDLGKGHGVTNMHWYFTRDMPGSFDMWLENVCDQSHLPYAHHGVAYDRDAPQANHFEISNVNQDLQENEEWGYKLEWYQDQKNLSLQEVSFISPCLIRFYTPRDMGLFSILYFYMVPVDANTTRMITNSLVKLPQQLEPFTAVLTSLLNSPLKSLAHLLLLEVFDGDIVLVFKQNRHTKIAGGKHLQNYYLPNQSDQSVIAWRKWWQAATGGAGVSYFGDTTLPCVDMEKTEMLDRFKQHTKSCSSCRSILHGVESAQNIARVAILLQLISAASIGQAQGALAPSVLGLGVGVAATIGIDFLLGLSKERFIYTGYVHGER